MAFHRVTETRSRLAKFEFRLAPFRILPLSLSHSPLRTRLEYTLNQCFRNGCQLRARDREIPFGSRGAATKSLIASSLALINR